MESLSELEKERRNRADTGDTGAVSREKRNYR